MIHSFNGPQMYTKANVLLYVFSFLINNIKSIQRNLLIETE
jgi:hypothetical protein